ncbi:MAG: galactokinase [Victivallaceae bacterium]|nr:galactokinase [Victivallaceae bacterium]
MTDLIAEFKKIYDRAPEVVSRAPGRLEVLGNHTDYNEGVVLSCAVEQAAHFAMAKRAGRICRIRDLREGVAAEFDLDRIAKAAPRDWSNYIRGVIVELRKRGIEIGAFDAVLDSSVPLSAGMSSSAALEMAAAMAFRTAYDIDLPLPEWARVGQGVENNYLGLKTGLLDQFSSLYGSKDSLILSDFRTVEVLKTVPLPTGFELVVANSMVKHTLVDSEYNSRRADCESAARKLAAALPGIRTLRDVLMSELEDHAQLLTDREFRRARHVVGECERVFAAERALARNDIGEFGALMFASHRSSQNNFENSCPELDVLVDFAVASPLCLGARLSGGGFGGITIHLVAASDVEEYTDKLRTHFQRVVQKDPQIIVCSVGDGATAEAL